MFVIEYVISLSLAQRKIKTCHRLQHVARVRERMFFVQSYVKDMDVSLLEVG